LNEFINFSTEEEYSDLEYLYHIGVSHAKRGNTRDAIFYFDKVLEVEPIHIKTLTNKGNALGKLGKYSLAIACYDKVLKYKPDHTTCLLNKGLALHYLKRYEQASSCYNKILSYEPNNANTLYHLACTKSLQNDLTLALEYLEKAILVDGEYSTKAVKDQDFTNLYNNSRFKSLIS
jgi:tetratricopeptide (TPR) repeat protein